MLALVERQFIDHVQGSCLREIKTAQRLFTPRNVERVLSSGDRVSTGSRREDLAGVVERLAPCKGASSAQTMPALNAELSLQSVISGPSSVLTVANVAEVAVFTPARKAGRCRRCARRYSGGNEGTETSRYQPTEGRVRVHRLEVAGNVVAHIADFEDHFARQFTLYAQRPFLGHRFMEVG